MGAIDSTIRISFGLVNGIFIAMALPLLYVIAPLFSKQYHLFILLLFLPILSYGISLGLNSFNQYIVCRKIKASQIALVSLLGPAFTFIFSLLAYLLPILRSPVESILPISSDSDMKYALGFSFYLLWAGIYAQNISSGMVQSCP